MRTPLSLMSAVRSDEHPLIPVCLVANDTFSFCRRKKDYGQSELVMEMYAFFSMKF